jgi:hypothetical protein
MPFVDWLTRRDWLHGAALGWAGAALSGWLGPLAARAAGDPRRKRSCILLWMAGGPAQTDTFDLKPDHANGGPFREIDTAAPGVRIGEHFPHLARQTSRLAVLRSMRTRERDHGRATAHLRTGYLPQGSIRFPSLGALVSHELAAAEADLPGFVSVTPQGAFAQPSVAAGFLGPRHAPLVVGGSGGLLRVEDLESRAVSAERARERLELLREMEANFLASRPGPGPPATSPPTTGPCASSARRRHAPSTCPRRRTRSATATAAACSARAACWRGGWWNAASRSWR